MGSLQGQAGKETISRYDISNRSTSGIIERTVTDLWALKAFWRGREGGKEEGFICQVWVKAEGLFVGVGALGLGDGSQAFLPYK